MFKPELNNKKSNDKITKSSKKAIKSKSNKNK